MNDGVRYLGKNPSLEAVAQLSETRAVRLTFGEGELRRARETNSRGDVLGPRPASTILGASVHQRLEMDAPANEQRANPLGGAELMTGDGQEVELLLLGVDRNLAKRLHRVGVEQRAMCLGFFGKFGDRLNGSDLIV